MEKDGTIATKIVDIVDEIAHAIEKDGTEHTFNLKQLPTELRKIGVFITATKKTRILELFSETSYSYMMGEAFVPINNSTIIHT
ncbi:MAG: hypothetical protein WC010_04020 [Candidatus Absconditabacterales bacterium]